MQVHSSYCFQSEYKFHSYSEYFLSSKLGNFLMVETRGNGKGGLGRFKRNHSLAEEANTDNSDQQQPTHPHNQPNLPHAVGLPPTNPTAESSPTNPTAESPPTHPSIVFNAENTSTQPPDACQDIGVEGDATNFGTSSVSSADGDDHGWSWCR